MILDAKLTFRDHVDAVVSKANRMLGLLMRSMQLSARARMTMVDHRVVLCAYYAHVRSILEYGSVIWGGAAVTHLARLERLQHRFLMWLGNKTHERCSMDYAALSRLFQCPSINARFVQSDVRFVRSVFGGRLDCSYLVSKFALLVPGRRSRHTGVLDVQSPAVATQHLRPAGSGNVIPTTASARPVLPALPCGEQSEHHVTRTNEVRPRD